MDEEILQEEIEIIPDFEDDLPDQQEAAVIEQETILEVEEGSSDLLEDELFPEESISNSQQEIVEPDYEVLDPDLASGISENSVSVNLLPDVDFPVYERVMYMVGSPESSETFLSMSINDLSSTDTLLFLIFCILLANFIHNIFKSSHFLRRIG